MKADEKLEELGIDFEKVEQDNPSKTCDDAAKERGLETSQIVKSLIIEARGENYHVLLPGDRELSERKLGEEYRMVPPEESREITGFESGTVHPFSTELLHLIDVRVFENERVSHTTGDRYNGVILDSDEFREAISEAGFEHEIGDFAVSNQDDYREIEAKGVGEEEAKFVVDSGYRKVFLELVEEFDHELILKLIEELERNELEIDEEIAEQILERSEDYTHLQKIVEEYSETGEIPDEEDFDLEDVVNEVIEENQKAVEDFRSGKDSALNFFIGQVMKETKGKADAGKARKLIQEEIG